MTELIAIATHLIAIGYLFAAIWLRMANRNWHFEAFMSLFAIMAAQQ
jgi:hypothetical protein